MAPTSDRPSGHRDNGTDDAPRVFSSVMDVSHHQYWLRDDAEPDLDTLGDNDDPGSHPLVAIDDSGRMASIHTGMYGFELPVTVQAWNHRPEPDLGDWEEAIEFSLLLRQGAHLESLMSDTAAEFDLPKAPASAGGAAQVDSYRIRLHATGRQAAEAKEHISADHGDELVERHLLQVWAAPSGPVRWLKELEDWPAWQPDTSAPPTDFYTQTSAGQYWLTDNSTGRHAADVTGIGNGVILPEPGGHMAAIFTAEPASIVEVKLDLLRNQPALELNDWEEIAEISMAFTGPYLDCNFLADDTSPYCYKDLPAAEGQTRTYRVRVSVKGRHRPHHLIGRTPGDDRHAERHMIQIWPAPERPDRNWKTHKG